MPHFWRVRRDHDAAFIGRMKLRAFRTARAMICAKSASVIRTREQPVAEYQRVIVITQRQVQYEIISVNICNSVQARKIYL